MPRPPMTPERFWAMTRWEGDCLIWPNHHPSGYGRVTFHGKAYKANRLAWTLAVDAIPDGLEVCHRCDNPACVRLEHLFLATHMENMRDMVAKGRSLRISLPGARNPWAKFSDSQVQSMRASYLAGTPVWSLARQYRVDRHTIGRIVHRKSYR